MDSGRVWDSDVAKHMQFLLSLQFQWDRYFFFSLLNTNINYDANKDRVTELKRFAAFKGKCN